ncbi:hypothetical protein AWC11_23190 [Mycobacterium interjectum]|nr:hypothetical protein AWC11_23190 [Mycobacterium interjectum]
MAVREYVVEAIAAHPSADVREIAEAAAGLAPAKELRSCLAEALVHVVREEIGRTRRDSIDGALGKKSPKLRDRASWWEKMLTERVNIGGALKPLGDCTFDELGLCIASREKLIGQISEQIDNYKHLQKLMVEHGAGRVRDIPAQTEWKRAS